MVQKSRRENHRLDGAKTMVNNGMYKTKALDFLLFNTVDG